MYNIWLTPDLNNAIHMKLTFVCWWPGANRCYIQAQSWWLQFLNTKRKVHLPVCTHTHTQRDTHRHRQTQTDRHTHTHIYIYGPTFWHPFACRSHDDRDDGIKWKHFPSYWTFAKRIHRSPVNSPYKGQWRGAWFFLSAPQQTVEYTIETPVIWDAIMLVITSL